MLMVLVMLKCRFCAAGCSAIAGNDDDLFEGVGKTLVGVEVWAEAIDVEWKCESGWSRWVLYGWGSSGGEPKGLVAVLASLRSFGSERGGMAAFLSFISLFCSFAGSMN